MTPIPDYGNAGYYQTVNGTITFIENLKVACSYNPSQQNIGFMPYFSFKEGRCGEEAAKITKPFLNGLLSQVYAVIDKAGIQLNDDWFCSQPTALYDAIVKLTDGELGGVIDG